MTDSNFDSLKDYILKLNKYYDSAYANAFKDEESSAVYVRSGKDLKMVFPDDRIGNFFYIRTEPNMAFQPDRGLATMDCGVGRVGFNDVATIQIVSVLRDGNALEMINNIRNSLMAYPNFNIIPIAAIWQRENVVLTEMSGFDEDVLRRIYARLKDETIVRVTAQITAQYLPSTCINNPCKSC